MRAAALLVCALAIGIVAKDLMGCAHGVDGLKQACANTDTVLTDAYQLDTAAMQAAIDHGQAAAHRQFFRDVTGTLDDATKTKADSCAAVVTGKGDWPTLIARVSQATADIAAAVARLKVELDTWKH